MAEDWKVFKSSFSSLPVELRHAILCEMPDFRTLQSAIDVDDSLRSVFWANESTILKNVMHKIVDSRLLPEVNAVIESTRFCFGKVKLRLPDDPWTKDGVCRLLNHYFQREPLSVNWNFADARTISELYEHIRFFVEDFASSMLSIHLATGYKQLALPPLSPNERCRLEGSFLRFELFCNLFRERSENQERFQVEELWEIFFAKLSPWENEQLACIHNYLTDKILIR